jgi:predicted TIM-barrel fold metal-dependent hydrolase
LLGGALPTEERIIDADAHVLESEETWDFLQPNENRFRPILVRPVADSGADQLWSIDGRTIASLAHRGLKATERRPSLVDVDATTLENVPKRLAQMDRLGVDIQVIFPTLFLHRLTDNVEAEQALARSYNRFMAAKCADTGGRLRWVMELPWISIPDALDELRACAELGACGVHAHGLEMGRIISDPYFFPVFEDAQTFELPICIHAGDGDWKSQGRTLATTAPTFILSKIPGIIAFHALFSVDIYRQFPDLRFGFIELSSDWIPYIASDLRLRYGRSDSSSPPQRLFDDKKIFVCCQNSDDLEHVLQHIDASRLLFGTDYSHTDTTADLEGISEFQATNKPEIVHQILSLNPQRFYRMS